MAVKLRLRRMGKKKQPIYKIVATDVRSPRDGRFLEAVGLYNPLTNPHTVNVKEDRVLYWLSNGAQPTKTVKSLLRQKGIILKNELIKKVVGEEKLETRFSEWQKIKEASASDKTKKKKISRKAKAKEEVSETEVTSSESSSKEENVDESTTEVKGAASDENEAGKE